MLPELRTDILAFYEDLSLPIATKTNAGEWTRLQEELQHLGAIDHDVSPVRPRVAAGLAIPAAK